MNAPTSLAQERASETAVYIDSRGPEPFARLASLALEADEPEIAAEATALSERLVEGRFYVACVGQFKRGKSTLLNALVGRPLLPTGLVPVTAVVTVLRYGARCSARVRFTGGAWQDIDPSQLAAYVSEEQNPENVKGVAAVEVFVPSPLLASGMCLVDTPGIGSVFQSNTAATSEFVPHIDAAVVLVGTDPPLSADELALMQDVSQHVRDLLFVLGKADRFSDAELREADRFTHRIVAQRLGRPPGCIYHVSALAQLTGSPAAWDWGRLVEALHRLAEEAGGELLQRAHERGTRLLVRRLLHALDAQRRALSQPLEETERQLNALRHCIEDAERSLNDLGYLFTGEQDRFSAWFAERREAFLGEALPHAQAELDAAIQSLNARRGSAWRRAAMSLAKDTAKRTLEGWLENEQPQAEAAYRKMAARFVDLANDFLARLARSGVPGLADICEEVSSDIGFRTPRRFYCHLDEAVLMMDVGALRNRCLDLILPRSRAVRRVQRAAGELLADLLRRNSVLIHNDFDERVAESRRRLEREIRERLGALLASAARVFERAQARNAAGTDAVRGDLARLDALRREAEAQLRAVSAERVSPEEG